MVFDSEFVEVKKYLIIKESRFIQIKNLVLVELSKERISEKDPEKVVKGATGTRAEKPKQLETLLSSRNTGQK